MAETANKNGLLTEVTDRLVATGFDRLSADEAINNFLQQVNTVAEMTSELNQDLRVELMTLVLLELLLNQTFRPHYTLYHNRDRLRENIVNRLVQEPESHLPESIYSSITELFFGKPLRLIEPDTQS